MYHTEFSLERVPLPRRGLTSIEAVQLMNREFPEVLVWTCWRVSMQPYASALGRLVGQGYAAEGEVGGWRWRRRKMSYPEVAYFDGQRFRATINRQWVGVLEIEGPLGERFMLSAFLTSTGDIGTFYLASTTDFALLERFGRDVAAALTVRGDGITVSICNGRDVSIPAEEENPLFLPESMLADIEGQARIFFENAKLFSRLRLRRRRGFLFAGTPGNGKTMMVRHLMRLVHKHYQAPLFSIVVRRHTDQDDLESLFSQASEESPSVVILEDIDSLTRETEVTRSSLLNLLDGFEPCEGVLVLATTNNPEDVDPALVQRPSRFDRVWRFGLPEAALRRRYLDWAFPKSAEAVRCRLAEGTSGWSFAFLNELRVSTAIQALREEREEVTESDLLAAYELLSVQFKTGKKGFCENEAAGKLGFGR